MTSNTNLSRAYRTSSVTQRHLGNIERAFDFARQAVSVGEQFEARVELRYAFENISELYAMMGKHEEAYQYLQRGVKLRDSLFSSTVQQSIGVMEMEQQAREQERLLQEQVVQRNTFMGATLGLFGIGGWLGWLYRQKRLAYKEIEEQAVQIQQMNNQLQEQNTVLEEKNEQLVLLDTEKNEFLGIVSHDLKNPIGAVRGFADLIQNGFTDGQQTQEVLAQIVTTSDRMLELVKNLLDVNRLEQGGMQFNIVAFDISPIVESTVWQYQAQAEAKNITLHFSAEAAENLVSADEQAMMQVLDNIVSNAVKYSPHGKNVYVCVKASNDAVRVEVQDEGQGISSEDMKKLFGKFVRLTARPTGGEHSTGLGLSIVKKMVEAMNGKVWCESEIGNGATFIVELPLQTTKI